MKKAAIREAIKAMERAITFRSRVGACLYTKDRLFTGFNIENKIHKGFHAEEVALIKALDADVDPSDFLGIVIVYSFNEKQTNIYPACASCRQYLWEFTSPDLLITVVDQKGNIRFEATLKELYPMPFPRNRWYKNEV